MTMDIQQNLFDNQGQRSIAPFKCDQPGRYIFETIPENKGDYIKREIDIIERGGDLGVQFNLVGNFIKVRDFRKDYRITLINVKNNS